MGSTVSPGRARGSKGRRVVIPQRKHCILSLEYCRMDAGHTRTAGVEHSEMASHKSSTQTFNSSQARFHIPWTSEGIPLPFFSEHLCFWSPGQEYIWIREESLGVWVDQIQSSRNVGTGGCMNRDTVGVVLMVAGFPRGHSRTLTSFRVFP